MITIRSAVLSGLQSIPVTVTATDSEGAFSLEIAGMTDTAAREARVRVKSALAQAGIKSDGARVRIEPEVHVTAGSQGLDLAIALAVALLRGRIFSLEDVKDAIVIGELSLTGHVHPIRGALAHACSAGKATIIVPKGNAWDAAVSDAEVLYCSDIEQAIAGNFERMPKHAPEVLSYATWGGDIRPELEFADIPHANVRRALEIAAVGHFPVLLVGSPGAGKTMAARRLAGIMQPLTNEEAIEVISIHDAAGLRSTQDRTSISRPFRAPHHTVSEVGLLGGGDSPRPGEVTLAHHGVLFLDEIAEFRKSALEALALVLNNGETTLWRKSVTIRMPARPLLVAAVNPCACGYRNDGSGRCVCSTDQMKRWHERAASYDRLFTLRVEIPSTFPASVTRKEILKGRVENTAEVLARVEAARAIIASTIPTIHVEALRMIDEADLGRKLRVTRGRVEAVARTIAALAGTDRISPEHMTEALALCGGEK
jgi:magnesium chelatase family protein